MRLALFSLLLIVWSGLAMAQEATQPPADDSGAAQTAPLDQAAPTDQAAPADQATAESATQRVLVIGDQLAGGMGSGLARMIQNDDQADFSVANRFNEASGLARPEIYDWAAAIPKMVQDKNFSAAVILMGLNDRRDMRDANGATLKFNTPEWDTLYKARIDAVIDALAAAKIKVYWMGEPPMGDPGLDADMQNITALIKDRVTAKGGVFVDLRAPFANTAGGYADRGPDDTGQDSKLRQSDGVTFMRLGNNRLGQLALTALKSDAGASPPAAAQASATAPAPADASSPAVQPPVTMVQPPADEGPIFGQEGVDTDTASHNSRDLTAGVEKDRAAQKAASASIIGVAAAKGSNAEALFTKGLAAPAPTGRFDDFTVSPN